MTFDDLPRIRVLGLDATDAELEAERDAKHHADVEAWLMGVRPRSEPSGYVDAYNSEPAQVVALITGQAVTE